MGWVAVLFALAMYLAWQRLAGVQDAYQLEQFQQQRQALVETNRKLRLEEAFLADPLRIDRLARTQLGMVPLAAHQIVPAQLPSVAEVPVVAQVRPLPPATKNVAAAVPQ
ncbi:MAG: cell division protein FtsL [Acidobacteria bacterium]|nr:cell division protein FtsL [Acidobacteriota bacterium]